MNVEEVYANLNKKIKNIQVSGGGVTDYPDLNEKPQINGVTLQGNKTSSDLDIIVPNTLPNPYPLNFKGYLQGSYDGSAEVNVQFPDIQVSKESAGTPVGEIISYMGNAVPENYLACDGSEYSIADYPYLAQHFIDNFGSVNYFGGDGEITFAVPDLRGEFLRGTGIATRETGSGTDVGKHQDATCHVNISNYIESGVIQVRSQTNGIANSTAQNMDTCVFANEYNNINIDTARENDPVNPSIPVTYTSRPTNTSILYCIKYRPTYFANIGIPMADNAASHNGMFRGKDLTDVYSMEEICSRISSGKFTDLYIGDYFDVTISTSYTENEIVRCILAGFDTYWNNGNVPFTQHHAAIVPKNCFAKTAQMNPTDTTVGGILGSAMWTTVLPIYTSALQAVFGNHLLMHKTILTNSVGVNLDSSAGAGYKGSSTGWNWTDTYINVLSEIQVCGSNVTSSSYFDIGCDNGQLPLFALDPTAKVCGKGNNKDGNGDGGRQMYWLKGVSSDVSFSRMGGDGVFGCDSASGSYGVRPIFCIG